MCDLINKFDGYNNVIILQNKSNCLFEIGAYKYGIEYMETCELLDKYCFFVFTQDNFILKNKYDFDILLKNNIFACTINEHSKVSNGKCGFFYSKDVQDMLTKVNNTENSQKIICVEDVTFCWCISFVLHKSVVLQFYEYIKDIVVTDRLESEYGERYMAIILYKLNNYKNFSIDGDANTIDLLGYDYMNVDPLNNNIKNFFVKKCQQKNEKTLDE